MEDDWISNFFDKCRLISDDQMQLLWAKLLAGEANSPGTYSKRTVNLLGTLDKIDAQLFTGLCSFIWCLPNIHLLVYDQNESVYNSKGINFASLTRLDEMGLIRLDFVGYKLKYLPQQFTASYYGKTVDLQFPNIKDNELKTGKVLLSSSGGELARICGAKPIDEFYEYVLERWQKAGLINPKNK